MGMFARFLDLLFPLRDTARTVAECSDTDLGRLVSPLQLSDEITALLPYRHRLVRSAIIEAKFKNNARAHQLLGTVLAEYLASYTHDSKAFEPQLYTALPIPLSTNRLRARGYNQVEAIARAGGIKIEPLLARTRDTAPQTTLTKRARLTNMQDSFSVVGTLDPARTYLVIDDVSTTGATLNAAVAALRAAGATNMRCIALAH